MDHSRLASGPIDDNVGIPDDLRCKRSDGKQWRCTAMSMPDKTVCEKHYIQAKKRAANSALKASMKKTRKSSEDGDGYLDCKSDDVDVPLLNAKFGDFAGSVVGRDYTENVPKRERSYSPEEPSTRVGYVRNSLKSDDDLEMDDMIYEDGRRSYATPPPSTAHASGDGSDKPLNSSPTTDTSDESTDSADDIVGEPCHQCQRRDKESIIWCSRCNKRGYCDVCISTWYSDITLEDIRKVCPACRGSCSCKLCLRGDNLVKAKIREMSSKDKLQYLYSLLSAVLPVLRQIHHDQYSEMELERKLRGNDMDLSRTKLDADEQMCCNFCRTPVIDYHRHCPNCSYDLCLSCCKDIRDASMLLREGITENQSRDESNNKEVVPVHVELSVVQLNRFRKCVDWRVSSDGSIPCPPKEYGGCGYDVLNLKRIFKMNWVAKLLKNVEEMVNGCSVCDPGNQKESEIDLRFFRAAHRDTGSDFLYHPSSQDIKIEGIGNFRIRWSQGEPVIIKEVCDVSSMAIWDPVVIWRGIRETTDEKHKDGNRMVKAVDSFDCSEVDIELGQFIEGYSEGRIRKDGQLELLKLKDWPSPCAAEEFLMYQRPDFISKLPLIEFIHSKWGLTNVAAKLPHYSLQNDVGPKFHISYGTNEELSRGNSVQSLQLNIRDMVFLLLHNCEAKLKDQPVPKIDTVHEAFGAFNGKLFPDSEVNLNGGFQQDGLKEEYENNCDKLGRQGIETASPKEDRTLECDDGIGSSENHAEKSRPGAVCRQGIETASPKEDITFERDGGIGRSENHAEKSRPGAVCRQGIVTASPKEDRTFECDDDIGSSENHAEKSRPGAVWDVFRRQDVPMLTQYLEIYRKEWEMPDSLLMNNSVLNPLYSGLVYLTRNQKKKLKEEFGVEPWSFEQHLGEAVFVPSGCPFQVRNLQSTVQLGLDFLTPESLGEAAKLSEEIRGLPNDHVAKLQILEVGKISLYAASWAIKEVQKLVLDPRLGTELGFEDPNLTALVSDNLEKMVKRRQMVRV